MAHLTLMRVPSSQTRSHSRELSFKKLPRAGADARQRTCAEGPETRAHSTHARTACTRTGILH